MVGKRVREAITKLKTHRGFHELLGYLVQLDDATVLHKDGALSRHFKYTPPDLSDAEPHFCDFCQNTWAQAVNFLGDGWMVETNLVAKPYQTSASSQAYPDVVSALIDDERRLMLNSGEYFENTLYLSITYKPEDLVDEKFKQFALVSDDGIDAEKNIDASITQFDKIVTEYIGFLSRALITIEPLSGNELTTFLYQSITGSNQYLNSPQIGTFLDCYLSNKDFVAGFAPRMGNKHIKVLTLDDLPNTTHPTILSMLSQFDCSYRWSSRFITLDKLTAKAYLKKYERNWSSKAIGILGVLKESLGMPVRLDLDAEMTAESLRSAQVDSSSGTLSYGFYNSTIILMGERPDYLKTVTEHLTKTIQQLEFKLRDESVNATDGFLGSLPGHGDYNLRKMLIDNQFVASALPISGSYQGSATSPCPKEGYKDAPALLATSTLAKRPFHLNLHVADVGHSAILGPTGTGKSTLIAAIMAGHRKYDGSRVIVLDKDLSNQIPILAMGGNYYQLDNPDCACQLSPLAMVAEEDTQSIDTAVSWLSEICLAQGLSITTTQQKRLMEAVLGLSREPQAFKNLDHLNIQDAEIRDALATFNAGQFKHFLNGTQPAFNDTSILGFDMGELIKADLSVSNKMLPVIKAIFNELERLFQDKRPTLLILEEAWSYLKHPIFKDKLTDWFKTLRKANVSILFVSQDLDDIVKSGAASTIQSSCMTRIYLANPNVREANITAQYQAFGLSDTQIGVIGELTRKQDYYYHSESGSQVFQLDLGPLAQSFLTVSEKNDIEKFHELVKASENGHDNSWMLDWLVYRGLDDWRDFAKSHYFKQEAADESN